MVNELTQTLASVIRSKVPLTGDGFRMAPPAEDPFWQMAQKELETGLGPKADAFWAAVSAALASRLGLECFPRSPAALAEYVSELESIDVTEVAPGLFLGNLSARSSELALCLLRCDRVVAVVPEGPSGKGLRESSGPARRYMPVDIASPSSCERRAFTPLAMNRSTAPRPSPSSCPPSSSSSEGGARWCAPRRVAASPPPSAPVPSPRRSQSLRRRLRGAWRHGGDRST